MTQTLIAKLTSRKFWLSLAAGLAAFGVGINALAANNDIVGVVCIVLAALSAAIYAACETACDVADIKQSSDTEGVTNGQVQD